MINVGINTNSYSFYSYNNQNNKIKNSNMQFNNNTIQDEKIEIDFKNKNSIIKFKGFIGSFTNPKIYPSYNVSNITKSDADRFLSSSPTKTDATKDITNDENKETIGEDYFQWLRNFDENNLYYSRKFKYSEKSTPDNPIVIVELEFRNGDKKTLEIDINKIDPKNATSIEMETLGAYLCNEGEISFIEFGSMFETPYAPIDKNKMKDVIRHCYNFNLEHNNGIDRCDFVAILMEKLELFYKVKDTSLSSKAENVLEVISRYPKNK